MWMNDEKLATHYCELVDRPFFPRLMNFMKSAPVVATCWEGLDAVATVRMMCGTTRARDAALGTIRGDLAMSTQANLVHASHTVERAQDELSQIFAPGEIVDYGDDNVGFVGSGSE
jgi:nucleoside-diphosphate kinase